MTLIDLQEHFANRLLDSPTDEVHGLGRELKIEPEAFFQHYNIFRNQILDMGLDKTLIPLLWRDVIEIANYKLL